MPAWINNHPSRIINDAGSSSVIEMGKKKNFILFFPYERATGFAMHFFLKKEKVPLKWRILKMVLEALEKTRNSF